MSIVITNDDGRLLVKKFSCFYCNKHFEHGETAMKTEAFTVDNLRAVLVGKKDDTVMLLHPFCLREVVRSSP